MTVSEEVLRQRQYQKNYRTKNREQYLERHRFNGRIRNAKHADRLNREAREYRVRNKEKIARWRDSNRDILRAKSKAYYHSNKEKEKARGKIYRANNAEKIRISAQAWHGRNRERSAENHREWKKRNPGRWNAIMHHRRALVREATINLRGIQKWMCMVKSKPTAKCYYCHRRIDSGNIHFDHIVALSKGGPHSVENLCVSCPACNLSKGDKPVRMWIKTGQELLEL